MLGAASVIPVPTIPRPDAVSFGDMTYLQFRDALVKTFVENPVDFRGNMLSLGFNSDKHLNELQDLCRGLFLAELHANTHWFGGRQYSELLVSVVSTLSMSYGSN